MLLPTLSEEQRAWLTRSLGDWQTAGIISADQGQRILGLYESPVQSRERQKSVANFVLQSLAALLLFLGLLLLVGYNWSELPRSVKLVSIFTILTGTHLGAFYLRYRLQRTLASEVAFFLGCLLYGVGIWLVAQIFHLDSHYPDGVWYWAIGVLPFALCLDTMLGHLLYVALLAIWVGMEIIGYNHLHSFLFRYWIQLPNIAISLPLLALPGILWAYFKNSPVTLVLYASLLGWWVTLQSFAWHHPDSTIWFVGIVGAIFLTIAEGHPARSRFASPFRGLGGLLSIVVLFILSFYDFHTRRKYGVITEVSEYEAVMMLFGLMIFATLATEALRGYLVPAEQRAVERGWIRRQWLPVSLASSMLLMALLNLQLSFDTNRFDPDSLDYGALVPTVVSNIAIVFVALWLIRMGIREGRTRPFAAGVICFLLWTVVRYFDLFGNFGGMLGAAGLFFLCGAVLFGVSRYWRGLKETQRGQ